MKKEKKDISSLKSCDIKTGTTVIFGDYEYRFNESYNGVENTWMINIQLNGWGVRVRNINKRKFADMMAAIKKYPVVSCDYTFYQCQNLTLAPALPKTVKYMSGTFMGCEKLKSYIGSIESEGNFANYPFPDAVTSLDKTFYGCRMMFRPPIIPDNVLSMRYTFGECKNLMCGSALPKNLKDKTGVFYKCSRMTMVAGLSTKTKKIDMACTAWQ